LDEILPKSKQKKLVLPYTASEAAVVPEAISKTSAGKEASEARKASTRIKGPAPPPDFDVQAVRELCSRTEADLEELDDSVLQKHVEELEKLAERGKEVLQYWVNRKQMAVGDKEAFDGVIENLVRHARRVRK